MEGKSGNAALLRQINQGIVLDALKKADVATVAQLSRQTGLSLATCATIAGDLVKLGEAVQLEEKSSQGGRPARHFRYNSNRTLLALLQVQSAKAGGEVLKTSLANAKGAVQASSQKGFKRITPGHIVTVLQKLQEANPNLRAAVIAVPGLVCERAVARCAAPGLADSRLAGQVWTHVGIPAVVENDLHLAALGYACRQGEDRGPARSRSYVYMAVPAGGPLGAGLVVNGVIHKGKSGFAGELSFALSEEDKRQDSQGAIGAEERLAQLIRALLNLTTSINPETVLLHGEGVTGEMLTEILAACRSRIPAEHLPEVILAGDPEGDIREGMLALQR